MFFPFRRKSSSKYWFVFFSTKNLSEEIMQASATFARTSNLIVGFIAKRDFHASQFLLRAKVRTARYKVTVKRDRPLTYEMANPPHFIAHRKAWNSWNTSNLQDGLRQSEMATEDMFIRKFMYGTWHNLFASEVIIKRRHNLIVIAGIVTQTFLPRKMYFLIGYTEEMLSYVLKCPIKLELQTVYDKREAVFKYI